MDNRPSMLKSTLIGGALLGYVLNDHVHRDIVLGEGLEDAGHDAGLIGYGPHGDLGLVFVRGDAGHDHRLEGLVFTHDPGAFGVGKTTSDVNGDAMFHCELH